MILLDANILVYSYVPSSPNHSAARAWLQDRLNGSARVGLPWPTLLAFVRLTGNRAVVSKPLSLGDAWSHVRQWLALPHTWTPLPTERHEAVLDDLLAGESRPDLVNDAHLAALAIEHGLTLCSTDGDFARFEGVRWENPLRG